MLQLEKKQVNSVITILVNVSSSSKLTEMINYKGTNVVSHYKYDYYLDGNKKSKEDVLTGKVTAYVYDGLGRLYSETITQAGTNLLEMKYSYDDYSNREIMTVREGNETVTTNYIYDKSSRLLEETKETSSGKEIIKYGYDHNGNQIFKKKITIASDTGTALSFDAYQAGTQESEDVSFYSYDGFNQLVNAIDNGKEISYTYDVNGLRRSKTVDGIKTTSIYDGQNLVLELNSSDQIVSKYVRGINLIKGYWNNGTTTDRHYLFNGHGDVVQLADNQGTVVKNYDYDAFGNEKEKVAGDVNPFRYCGEYWDEETGTYYLRARYYNPVTGRFTAEDLHWNPSNMIYGDNSVNINEQHDPLGLTIYTYTPDINAIRQSTNLYVYGMNNPVMYIDSDGEVAFLATMAIGAGVGAIVSGGFQVYRNIKSGNKWHQGLGKAMLAGGVSGAIATVPIPGLGAVLGNAGAAATSAIIMGGVGNTAANLIKGDISNFKDVLSSFGAGAVAGGIGYGAGAGLMKVADKFWGELSRTAQKQAITGLGKVSQAQVNVVLKQIKNGVTDNIYRQLVKNYGMDVVLAATVSAVSTEVKGK